VWVELPIENGCIKRRWMSEWQLLEVRTWYWATCNQTSPLQYVVERKRQLGLDFAIRDFTFTNMGEMYWGNIGIPANAGPDAYCPFTPYLKSQEEEGDIEYSRK
jgi:hypothetical protein